VLIASDGPAARRATADHLSRLPRRLSDRPLDRSHPRGRPSFRQLGRASSPTRRSSSCMRSAPSSADWADPRSPAFVPDAIPSVGQARACRREVASGPGETAIDPSWGEPGLTLAEKVYRWCTFENSRDERRQSGQSRPRHPARPPHGHRSGSSRGVDPSAFLPALRCHLDRHGFPMVGIAKARDEIFHASRLDPEHPWPSGRRPR